MLRCIKNSGDSFNSFWHIFGIWDIRTEICKFYCTCCMFSDCSTWASIMPDFMCFTRVFCSNSQMKSPGITTCIAGKNKTLYMQTVKSIEQRTKENLKKTLKGKFEWSSSIAGICDKFALYCNFKLWVFLL